MPLYSYDHWISLEVSQIYLLSSATISPFDTLPFVKDVRLGQMTSELPQTAEEEDGPIADQSDGFQVQ